MNLQYIEYEQKEVAEENEYPTQTVTLERFFIGETEVTKGLWKVVMGEDWRDKYGGAIVYKNDYSHTIDI